MSWIVELRPSAVGDQAVGAGVVDRASMAEHAGQHGAEEAADAVDAEGVERVVVLEAAA